VIVRDDVRVSGALGNNLRALDPGFQLVEGIEVVVAVAGLLVFREPVLVVGMYPVGEVTWALGAMDFANSGYIDVTEPDPSSASMSRMACWFQLACRTSRTRGKSRKRRNKSKRYARLPSSFRHDHGNCRSSAPRRPASGNGVIPSLNCRSSSTVTFRSCVKPRKSFAVNRKRGFAPTRRAQLFAIQALAGSRTWS